MFCISSSKELTKDSKITKKRVTGFVLVKLSDFKDKENAPQSTNKEKRSHIQKTKTCSGHRFLLCKTCCFIGYLVAVGILF